MTGEELKTILLYEHKRDLRLTYIQYSIIGLVALLVLGLITYFILASGGSITGLASNIVDESVGSFSQNEYAMYYKLIIPLAFLSCIGYFVYGIVKLHRRPKHIDEFLQLLEKGSKPVSITDSKTYKLKIPLLVVILNTCPVTSLHVVFQHSRKAYSLPVPLSKLEAIKDILAENS